MKQGRDGYVWVHECFFVHQLILEMWHEDSVLTFVFYDYLLMPRHELVLLGHLIFRVEPSLWGSFCLRFGFNYP